MSIDPNLAKAIFLAALEKDGLQRAAYLDTACTADPALRQRVEAMLHAHEDSGGLLARAPADMLTDEGVAPDATEAFSTDPASPPTEGVAENLDDGLTFLAPPVRAGSIGRLGHYHVQEVIGKGGFGIVLKAFDEKLHRIVAIKVMAPELAANTSARKRFIREARAAAAVTHEHIVAIHAIEEEHRPPYIVMQLVDGVSLQDKLNKTGPLDLREILRIGLQIASGLAAAQKQGLVHRDIKPANILLENGIERVKITDFGLARTADDASVTQSGTVAGTPMYMSPEQANGEHVDHRSDLFSLGTVLYAMCTGRPPFRASSSMAVLKRVCEDTPTPIQEVNAEIPAWLAAIIAKLHAKKPAERFQTAKEVAELLGEHLARLQQPSFAALPYAPAGPNERSRLSTLRRYWSASAALTRHSGSTRWAVAIPIAAGVLMVAIALTIRFWPPGDKEVTPVTPPPPVVAVTDNDGWVQLFNGKDLSGWRYHADLPGEWKVEKGILVSGGKGPLYTERSDFGNFHLRAEFQINQGGDSGIFFRVDPEKLRTIFETRQPVGFEAQISGLPDTSLQTGSLLGVPPDHWFREMLVKPREWGVMEIMADGNKLTIKVNGTTTVDVAHTGLKRESGAIALQQFRPDSIIHFKKIEIKELPRAASEVPLLVRTFEGEDSQLWAVALSRDGARALTGHSNGQVVLWDTASGKIVRRLKGHVGHVEAVAFGPDGKSALSTGEDKLARIWDLESGQQRGEIEGLGQAGTKLAAFRDGKRALTSGMSMHLLNLESRKVGKEFDPGKKQFDAIAIALSADEKFALCGGMSNTMWLWNVESGAMIRPFQAGHKGQIRSVAFSPNGARAVSASIDGTCRVWGVATGAELLVFDKHTPEAQDVAFLPDGRHVVSTAWDKTLRVWDSSTGQEIHKIGLPAAGARLAIAPDGRHVLVGLDTHNAGPNVANLQLWQLPPLPNAVAESGWVQLFNGKDLTGWKTHPDQPGDWKVEDGSLVGSGRRSHLFSERGDFENFHLRFDARLKARGTSGVFFRAPFGLPLFTKWGSLPGGFYADFRANESTVTAGALQSMGPKPSLAPVKIPTDTWFTEEIITQGERIILKVNGVTTSDFRDPERKFIKGHIALRVVDDTPTVVHFRKIEIQELPPSTTQLPRADKDSWVPLFNGKDMTGWKYHPSLAGGWKVEDGLLTSAGMPSYLFSERSDCTNFHLRAEAKINAAGDSGIFFRVPFAFLNIKVGTRSFKRPSGNEAQIFGGNGPINTGSLKGKQTIKTNSFTPPGEWFKLEVIAEGNRIIIKVNGNTTIDYTEEDGDPRGHIALQQLTQDTVVQFKKIEIKELPSSPPALFAGAIRAGRHLAPDLSRVKPLYEDRFQDPASGWGTGKGSYYETGYQDTRYFMAVTPGFVHAQHCSAKPTGDFACEVVGRTVGSPASSWGLAIQNLLLRRSLWFKLNGKQELQIESHAELANMIAPQRLVQVQHPAIKPGEEFNKLLVIERGQAYEVYVNGVLVCEPVATDFVNIPATCGLAVFAGPKAVRAEFDRFTVWNADGLPMASSPRRYRNSVGMEFAVVPKGRSWLGGGQDRPGEKEAEFRHDFYLGTYEVTQEEWEKVMGAGSNPSHFSRKGQGNSAVQKIPDAELKRFPVENVSWEDCQKFIAKLNELEKDTGWVYRLPTLTEWEYACRGGPMVGPAGSAYDFYLEKPANQLLPGQANFSFAGGSNRTTKVGASPPNWLGLYDMHGNVSEWCHDAFPPDPDNPKAGPRHVHRGGCWSLTAEWCRASIHSSFPPAPRKYDRGLRLARIPANTQ